MDLPNIPFVSINSNRVPKSYHFNIENINLVKRYHVDESMLSFIHSYLPGNIESNFIEDLLMDRSMLADEVEENFSKFFYPPTNYNSASVISLYKNGSKPDSFVEDILVEAYRGTKRRNSIDSFCFRCSLISDDSKYIHQFEFNHEKDYWIFLGALKRSIRNIFSFHYSGNCKYSLASYLSKNENLQSLNVENNKKRLFGFKNIKENNHNNSGSNFNFQFFENHILINQTTASKSDKNELKISLDTIKAIALNYDSEIPKRFLLKACLELKTKGDENQYEITPKDFFIDFSEHESNESPLESDPVLLNFISPDHQAILALDESHFSFYTNEHTPIHDTLQTESVTSPSLEEKISLQNENPKLIKLSIYKDRKKSTLITSQEIPLGLFIISPLSARSNQMIAESSGSSSPRSPGRDLYSSPRTPSSNLSSSNTNNIFNKIKSPLSFRSKASSPMKNDHPVELREYSILSERDLVGPMNKPPLNLNQPIAKEFSLSQNYFKKALKIVIKSASELPYSSNKNKEVNEPPNAFCTVYLMGQRGEKLTSNSVECRTTSIKSLNPEWNTEIIIRDDRISSGESASVMVLIRDSSYGYLKHHHLGQVSIPIDCFLPNSEADLCLPIEPSYRMDKDINEITYIGNLNVSTRLIEVLNLDQQRNHNMFGKKMMKLDHSGSNHISRDKNEDVNAAIQYSLHRNMAFNTWWPMKPLLLSSTDSSSSNHLNYNGFIFCGLNSFQLKLIPGSIGTLYNCKESIEGSISVDWADVNDAVEISDASVIVSLELNLCVSNPTQISKGELHYVPGNIEILVTPCNSVELCICIYERKKFYNTRKKLLELHSKIEAFAKQEREQQIGSNSPLAHLTRFRKSQIDLFSKPSCNSYPLVEWIPQIRDLADQMEKDFLIFQQVADDLKPPECISLPGSESFDFNSLTPRDHSRSQIVYFYLKYMVLKSKMYIDFLNVTSRASLRFKDCFIDGDRFPAFNLELVPAIVSTDSEEVQLFTPLRELARTDTIISRLSRFIDLASRNIRDAILFAPTNEMSITIQAATSFYLRGTKDPPSLKKKFSAEMNFILKLISEYFLVIQRFLSKYISSKEVFLGLKGQELKNVVMKMLIQNNSKYHEFISRMLTIYFNASLSSRLALVSDFPVVIDWYSHSLFKDLKFWLSRTLENATKKKTNQLGFPWDFELVGSKYCSHIPETLRFQLNVYFDNCVFEQEKSLSDDDNEYDPLFEYLLELPIFQKHPSLYKQVHGNLKNHISGNFHLDEEFEHNLNDKLVLGISQTLFLLAEEYSRALQSKHWDQGDPATNESAQNINFLVSVINDCHRISTTHLEPLRSITTSERFNEKKIQFIEHSYRSVAEKSVRNICRAIFGDFQGTLIEFENIWSDTTFHIRKTILQGLSEHFRSIHSTLESIYFLKILEYSSKVLCLRHLYAIKERSLHHNSSASTSNGNAVPPLTLEECNRFRLNVKEFRGFFLDYLNKIISKEHSKDHQKLANMGKKLSPSPHPIQEAPELGFIPALGDSFEAHIECENTILSNFSYLELVVVLLCEDFDSSLFLKALQELYSKYLYSLEVRNFIHAHPARRYDMVAFIDNLLFHCISQIRPDAGEDLSSFLQTTKEAFESDGDPGVSLHSRDYILKSGINSQKLSKEEHLFDLHEDLYFRIFGSSERLLAAQSSNKDKGAFSNSHSNNYINEDSAEMLQIKEHDAYYHSNQRNTSQQESTVNPNGIDISESDATPHSGGLKGFLSPIGKFPGASMGANLTGSGFKSFKPSSALKNLREKAADLTLNRNFAIVPAANKRQNEEYALKMMRSIGLEAQRLSSDDHIHFGHSMVNNHIRKELFAKTITEFESSENESIDDSNLSKNPSHIQRNSSISLEVGKDHISSIAHDTSIAHVSFSRIKVRKLQSYSFFGGPNPYIKFHIGNYSCKTYVIRNHSEAEWTESYYINLPSHLLSYEPLIVKVFDKERIRRKRLIGMTSISLSSLELRNIESWFALEGGESGSNGEIYFEVVLRNRYSVD